MDEKKFSAGNITGRNSRKIKRRQEAAKPFAVIESMSRLKLLHLTIRVWRQETEVKCWYDNRDIEEAINHWYCTVSRAMDIHRGDLATMVGAMPRVNAVEVVDTEGNGLVLYREWP